MNPGLKRGAYGLLLAAMVGGGAAVGAAAGPIDVGGNPMLAGAAMAFSSVFVVSNSLHLRRFQAR